MAAREHRHIGRRVTSWVLLVVATLLVPLSVLVSWTAVRLADESAFVETFAPLAGDEDVQAAVIDSSIALIESSVDIDGLTSAAVGQLTGRGLPNAADSAIKLLGGVAADGVRAAIERTLTELVHSDMFERTWEGALRLSHRTLEATARGSAFNGALQVSEGANLDLEVGDLVAQLRERLIANGYAFAEAIPAVDVSITLVHSDVLPTVALVYGITTAAGWWLPIAAVVVFALSVLIAPSRPRALMRAGIGLALGAALLLIVIAIGGSFAGGVGPEGGVTAAAASAIFAQIVGALRVTSWVLVALGAAVAVTAWVSGRRSRGSELPDADPAR